MALDNLIKDFPEQFQGKHNIEALCSAFDEQIAELFDVFMSIKSDTTLGTAVGKQLDFIGDIVGLTRAEAAILCGDEINFNEAGNSRYVIDDERYRPYLKYKAYKNSNGCTYTDVIEELKTVAGIDNAKYEEDAQYPATVILSIPLSAEDDNQTIGSIPTLAPAGVAVLYKFRFGSTINVQMISEINVPERAYCGTFYAGTFPKQD